MISNLDFTAFFYGVPILFDFINTRGFIGFVGSGIQYLNSHKRSKSIKIGSNTARLWVLNWGVEQSAPFFCVFTPRNSLVGI